MSLKKTIFSLFIGMFFCINTALSSVTKTNFGHITGLHSWKNFDGFIVDFDNYLIPPSIADQVHRKGKYILPITHPHYQQTVNLLTTAAIANLDVSFWVTDDQQNNGMPIIEDVEIKTQR